MFDPNKMILSFKTQGLEKKKEKTISLLSWIKNPNPLFKEIITLVENNAPWIDSEFLDYVYEQIIYFGDNMIKIGKELLNEKLNNVKNYLKNMHLKEEQEKEKEGSDSKLEEMLQAI